MDPYNRKRRGVLGKIVSCVVARTPSGSISCIIRATTTDWSGSLTDKSYQMRSLSASQVIRTGMTSDLHLLMSIYRHSRCKKPVAYMKSKSQSTRCQQTALTIEIQRHNITLQHIDVCRPVNGVLIPTPLTAGTALTGVHAVTLSTPTAMTKYMHACPIWDPCAALHSVMYLSQAWVPTRNSKASMVRGHRGNQERMPQVEVTGVLLAPDVRSQSLATEEEARRLNRATELRVPASAVLLLNVSNDQVACLVRFRPFVNARNDLFSDCLVQWLAGNQAEWALGHCLRASRLCKRSATHFCAAPSGTCV